MGWASFRDKYVTGGLLDNTPDRVKEEIDTIKGAVDDITGKTGERSASEAARTEAEAMTQQLNYLKEINKLPQQYKEEALTRLNQIYSGGPEGIQAQQSIIDQVKASPLYQQSLGAGEEAVARHAATTGGLRSGRVQEAMYDYGNRALQSGYQDIMGGVQGLAGLPTMERDIGQAYGDIGRVKAEGILSAAQARQAGTANMMNLGLGLGGLALGFARL